MTAKKTAAEGKSGGSKINQVVFEHVRKYNKANGYGSGEADVIGTINYGDVMSKELENKCRWWNEYFIVVKVDGMLIGYVDAEANRDESVGDLGYEFDPSSIGEVVAEEVTVIKYKYKG